MRAWIQNSLLGSPSPSSRLPSVSRMSRRLASAKAGLRRVGNTNWLAPGMRALTWPNAVDRPNFSMMRLPVATSARRSLSADTGFLQVISEDYARGRLVEAAGLFGEGVEEAVKAGPDGRGGLALELLDLAA